MNTNPMQLLTRGQLIEAIKANQAERGEILSKAVRSKSNATRAKLRARSILLAAAGDSLWEQLAVVTIVEAFGLHPTCPRCGSTLLTETPDDDDIATACGACDWYERRGEEDEVLS